jgi:hypothetical protein
MKLLQKFLIVALSLGAVSGAWAEDLQKLLTEGQTALLRGDTATAKLYFQKVNQADPRNPVAIGYLRQIAVEEAKNTGAGGQEARLKQLVIPEVQLKEATFGSALDALKKKVADASGGKQSINFVVQLSPEQQNTPVTLSLTGVPFTEVLRYVAEQVGAKVEYQKFAIVIKPAGGAAPTSKPGEVPAPQ